MISLPRINEDKANHFIYGFIIFIMSNYFLNDYYSFGITLITAILKELYDQYKWKNGDYLDVIYTIIPSVILIINKIINI